MSFVRAPSVLLPFSLSLFSLHLSLHVVLALSTVYCVSTCLSDHIPVNAFVRRGGSERQREKERMIE